RDAAGAVVQRAVQQLDAVELRGVGDAVDAVENRVHLQLIGLDLIRRQRTGVRRLIGQRLRFQEQGGNLAQRAFGRVDHVPGALRVVDRLVDPGNFAAKTFAGDQTGRVILAAVDS